MTVRDRDNGAKKFIRKMKSRISVKVGILGSDASRAHEGSEETVVEIGSKHEFGIDVPQRSFIRETVDGDKNKIGKIVSHAMRQFIGNKNSRPERIGDLIGIQLQALIQERMSDGIPPPNSQSTINRKGSSTPLIDTGQLRSSISFETEVIRRG
jgi:hypothetical protein